MGKTATACLIAQELQGEIVSADSRQIYKGLDIGTAKPEPRELESAKHHMLDVVEPSEYFDAARFSSMARECFERIAADGKVPMLVGGTGLYIKAALEGLFPGPGRDKTLREKLRAEERAAPGSLHGRLRDVDPKKATKVSPRDLGRIIRALEVYELTGVPLSEAQATWPPDSLPHLTVGLNRPRDELYRRIDSRVMQMVRSGLFEEVKSLLEGGVPADAPGLKTIGYREIVAHLAGDLDREEAVDLVVRNSRRYAKRQMTWFRGMSVWRWISLSETPDAATQVVREWRRTAG